MALLQVGETIDLMEDLFLELTGESFERLP